MTTSQELQVRRAAARHLSGIPARQNAASIDHLETQLLLEQLHAEVGEEEIARWERMEWSVFA
jgi:hypothetical protein